MTLGELKTKIDNYLNKGVDKNTPIILDVLDVETDRFETYNIDIYQGNNQIVIEKDDLLSNWKERDNGTYLDCIS